MNLSITQVQNVLRTYQKQVREERVKGILGVDEEPSRWKDRLDISREGRNRLQEDPSSNPAQEDPTNPLP
jgi:hypothetical protein